MRRNRAILERIGVKRAKNRDGMGKWAKMYFVFNQIRRFGGLNMAQVERGDALRELDEAVLAFRVARRGSTRVDGWLRTVRRAVGIPVKELTQRLGVCRAEIFRLEGSERAGTLGLEKLKGAAEALGCELVYGLMPKEGTLAAMAAAIEAGRAQRRAEARVRRLEKIREQRREAAKQSWRAQQREKKAEEWRRYWEAWRVECPEGVRMRAPKALRETPWWREKMRRALKKALREKGIRLR
jgi:predicted DNA-binding mobile mystery protein A